MHSSIPCSGSSFSSMRAASLGSFIWLLNVSYSCSMSTSVPGYSLLAQAPIPHRCTVQFRAPETAGQLDGSVHLLPLWVHSSSMSTSMSGLSPPGSGSCSSPLKAAIRGARGCWPTGGWECCACAGAAGASVAASPCRRICRRLPACGPRLALLWPLPAALQHPKESQHRVPRSLSVATSAPAWILRADEPCLGYWRANAVCEIPEQLISIQDCRSPLLTVKDRLIAYLSDWGSSILCSLTWASCMLIPSRQSSSGGNRKPCLQLAQHLGTV